MLLASQILLSWSPDLFRARVVQMLSEINMSLSPQGFIIPSFLQGSGSFLQHPHLTQWHFPALHSLLLLLPVEQLLPVLHSSTGLILGVCLCQELDSRILWVPSNSGFSMKSLLPSLGFSWFGLALFGVHFPFFGVVWSAHLRLLLTQIHLLGLSTLLMTGLSINLIPKIRFIFFIPVCSWPI